MNLKRIETIYEFIMKNYSKNDIYSIGNYLDISRDEYEHSHSNKGELIHDFLNAISERDKWKELFGVLLENDRFSRKKLFELKMDVFSDDDTDDKTDETKKDEIAIPQPVDFGGVYLKTGLKAIIIGVEEYSIYRNRSLPSARTDAERMAEFLKNDWRINEDDIHLIIDNKMAGKHVCYKDTISAIREVCEKLTEEDNLLFYYAGHGAEIDNHTYLMMYDSIPKLDTVVNSISLVELNEIVSKCKAKIKFRLFDACHSGEPSSRDVQSQMPVYHSRMSENMLKELHISSKGWITFCACDIDELSYDTNAGGYFTIRLLEGLRGKARRNGILYLEDVKLYVCRTVPLDARNVPAYVGNGKQNPKYLCELSGNIIVE